MTLFGSQLWTKRRPRVKSELEIDGCTRKAVIHSRGMLFTDKDGNMVDICFVKLSNYTSYWWCSTVVRTSVYDRRTFPGLRRDAQLTGDLLRVNHPLYVSQHGQLSYLSTWGR